MMEYIVGEELKKLQNIELEMLKEFVRVCGELDLTYYLVAGTLLGAVRHGGFIPWDDDIDVGMPRADYEIFLEHGAEYLQKQYFLQTNATDPEFPLNHAKIRDNRTTFYETLVKDFSMNHGVFIDVFPLDVYPDGKLSAAFLEFKKKMLTERIKEAFYYETPLKRSLKGKLTVGVMKLLYPDYKKAVAARERVIKSAKKGSLLANQGGLWDEPEIVPAEWCGRETKLNFEDMEVRVPEKYEQWLTAMYGDYRKFPPVEKRVTHHYTEAVDLKVPYTEIVKRLKGQGEENKDE